MSLDGKVVVVTGAAGGFGRVICSSFLEAGSKVIAIDVSTDALETLQSENAHFQKDNFVTKAIDISNYKQCKTAIEETANYFSGIDILINNAFFNPSINQSQKMKKFETFPLEVWNKVIGVNLTGVFVCSQELGSIMAKEKGGVIVNISSIYGMVGADQRIYGESGLNSQPSYAATKGAIVNLTRYLAAYWNGKNVRVNTLTLGGVLDKSYMKESFIKKYSEKTILGRMANKNEYNGALLFLVSDASSYMTGTNLVIDGGWTAW